MRKTAQKNTLRNISVGSALALAGGLGLGAAVMYLLDPQLGRRRRALIAHAAESAVGATVHRAADLASHRAARASDKAHEYLSRAGQRITDVVGVPHPQPIRPARSTVRVVALLSAGAGLMYFLDPAKGRARRAWASDKAMALSRRTAKRAVGLSHHLGNRLQGAVARAGHLMPESWKDGEQPAAPEAEHLETAL